MADHVRTCYPADKQAVIDNIIRGNREAIERLGLSRVEDAGSLKNDEAWSDSHPTPGWLDLLGASRAGRRSISRAAGMHRPDPLNHHNWRHRSAGCTALARLSRAGVLCFVSVALTGCSGPSLLDRLFGSGPDEPTAKERESGTEADRLAIGALAPFVWGGLGLGGLALVASAVSRGFVPIRYGLIGVATGAIAWVAISWVETFGRAVVWVTFAALVLWGAWTLWASLRGGTHLTKKAIHKVKNGRGKRPLAEAMLGQSSSAASAPSPSSSSSTSSSGQGENDDSGAR